MTSEKRRYKKSTRLFADRVARAAVRLAMWELERVYEQNRKPSEMAYYFDLIDVENRPGAKADVTIEVREAPFAVPTMGPWVHSTRVGFSLDFSNLGDRSRDHKEWDWNSIRSHVMRRMKAALKLAGVRELDEPERPKALKRTTK